MGRNDRGSSPDTRMLRVFHEELRNLIHHGVLPPTVLVLRDLDGNLAFHRLKEAAQRVPTIVVARLADREVVEAAFSVDRWAKPGQDVGYANLLTVCHWRRGGDWRMAIVEYRAEPTHVKPFDWHNPFWTRAQASELYLLDKATAEARRETRRPVSRDAARSHS